MTKKKAETAESINDTQGRQNVENKSDKADVPVASQSLGAKFDILQRIAEQTRLAVEAEENAKVWDVLNQPATFRSETPACDSENTSFEETIVLEIGEIRGVVKNTGSKYWDGQTVCLLEFPDSKTKCNVRLKCHVRSIENGNTTWVDDDCLTLTWI